MMYFPDRRKTVYNSILKEEPKQVTQAPLPKSIEIVNSENNVPALPSTTTMAMNLGKSILKTAKSILKKQPLRSTDEEAKRRLEICNNCAFFRKVDQRCSKCGCYMAIKSYLRIESCPVGKW